MEIQGLTLPMGRHLDKGQVLYFCSLCGHTKTETAFLEETQAG